MHLSSIKLALLVFLSFSTFLCCRADAQDELINLPEYSLPITARKLVIAHCMTNIIRFKGHSFEDSCNPDYYSPRNNASAALGGLTQVKVMSDSLLSSASIEQAVEFEMRAAIRSGIDGFQFYYTLDNPGWDEIIKAYFRVADQKAIDFKFTFCISHPNGSTEEKKIAQFSSRMNGIFRAVGRNNKHWLRSPDGRLVIYLWDGENLADLPADGKKLAPQYYIARAYKRLADQVHERFACVFTINKEISDQELNAFLDYFPATWMWTLPYDSENYIGERIARTCRRRKRTFTASVFNDFYTSKLLRKNSWEMYHQVGDAVLAGIDKVERKYITTGLSYNFRKLLEFGISKDAPIINVITWNDYPEGHHLAPEINHNEGFSILLQAYKSRWKHQRSPYYKKDVAIVFFKKYSHNIRPFPYNIAVVPFQKEVIEAAYEDYLEGVTLLSKPALLRLNGSLKLVRPGLQVSRFPMQNGKVKLSLERGGKILHAFTTPEGITDQPYRSDRLTYSFSTEFNNFYFNLYPGFKPIYSTEYPQ